MALPMLGEFALRMAVGLAAVLLLTPPREVPPAYFRTQSQIVLGLLVLAALDLARASGDRSILVATIVGAVLAYPASIAWGLGFHRVGLPLTAAVAASASIPLAWAPGGALVVAGRLASAALLGSSLAAMLLGHHYLTAPAMTIVPLRRLVALFGGSLAARIVLAGVGLGLGLAGASADRYTILFLITRWSLGLLGPAVACVLAWRTVQIRSTQSATGILYIGATLVLFGELTALTLTRPSGLFF